MAKVDEFGIEMDEELERAMADPKSGILTKAVDYLVQRREAKQAKEAKEKKEKEDKEKRSSIFGGMFE